MEIFVGENDGDIIITNSSSKTIAEQIYDLRDLIEPWFVEQYTLVQPPVYSSVDIRDGGFKIASVDQNNFPAGFNNLLSLCDNSLEISSTAFRQYVEKTHGSINTIALIPENHTTNLSYLQNVYDLAQIIKSAGYDVTIASLNHDIFSNGYVELNTSDGDTLKLNEIKEKDGFVVVNDKRPDLWLSNNDLSSGIPWDLTNLTQPIDPPLDKGWHVRKKNVHQESYSLLVNEFSTDFGLDSWQLIPQSKLVEKVNVKAKVGIDEVYSTTHDMFENIRAEYDVHNVDAKPSIFIKSNNGTYGTNTISILSPDEIKTLNSKTRKKLVSGKGKRPIRELLIQEGVPTRLFYDESHPSEPVVYLIGGEVVGIYARTNMADVSTHNTNLNRPGQTFKRIDDLDNISGADKYAYGVIARLATLASSYEL